MNGRCTRYGTVMFDGETRRWGAREIGRRFEDMSAKPKVLKRPQVPQSPNRSLICLIYSLTTDGHNYNTLWVWECCLTLSSVLTTVELFKTRFLSKE